MFQSMLLSAIVGAAGSPFVPTADTATIDIAQLATSGTTLSVLILFLFYAMPKMADKLGVTALQIITFVDRQNEHQRQVTRELMVNEQVQCNHQFDRLMSVFDNRLAAMERLLSKIADHPPTNHQ